MRAFIDRLLNYEPFQAVLRRLESSGGGPIDIAGLHGSAGALFAAALRERLPERVSILCALPTQSDARRLQTDLEAFGVESAACFPLVPDIYGELGSESLWSLRADRMEAIDALLSDGGIVSAPVYALAQRLPPVAEAFASSPRLSVGDSFGFERLTATLNRLGYRRVDTVESRGKYAVRGGIVDAFPPTFDMPARIEFWGDDIESIRGFDVSTQRSLQPLEEARLLPARELLWSDSNEWNEKARHEWASRANARAAEEPSRQLRNEIDGLSEELFSGQHPSGMERYYPLLFPDGGTLLDTAPGDSVLLMSEPRWMFREYARFLEKTDSLAEQLREEGRLWTTAAEAYLSETELRERMRRFSAVRSSLTPLDASLDRSLDADGGSRTERIDFQTQPVALGKGGLQSFLDALKGWTDEGYQTLIGCGGEKPRRQLLDILEERGLRSGAVEASAAPLVDSFFCEPLQIAAVSHESAFGRGRAPSARTRKRSGSPLLSLVELSEGDYVVHIAHGVGRYIGIRRMASDGHEQDFLTLQYGGGETLYVPVHHIDMVQRYVGPQGEKGPPLDRIGGSAWKRASARAKRSAEDMAQELLTLYAEREAMPGRAFSLDTAWQREFEAAFPYEETPDQAAAIEDVKEDMERARPMDRLICGDVGYGKTEVAMRAAFKAVMDGAQAAFLAPTTVLAQQHYRTIVERFKEFPVQTRMLSRLSPPKENRRAVESLANGTADIVVGTHRLLGSDVSFRQLGLLVIDEEHRFGVKQKERLKRLKKGVDTLTLTATPIPRTLHMAVSGARDMSVIATPPENRLSIETYVTEYRPELVRSAVLRELGRGGQAFFVHNRVQGIQTVAENLRQLIPEARIAVAHGQMRETALEDAMLRFIQHESDILVCTTIIESGLDIPNVNTIFINRADALGLAQLYQLRGRVGRSDRRAYGYLLYPDDRTLTETSLKRLRVIEEFTELGAGFKIALRDMEIRGSGNLLGPEQHGHMAAVGYDLYCKLLSGAVAELKGEEIEEEVETKIRFPMAAFIPDEYVPDSGAKFALYRRIARMRTAEDRDRILDEMRDRYGRPPMEAAHLLEISCLKGRASALGARSLSAVGGEAELLFDEKRAKIDLNRALEFVQTEPGARLLPPAQISAPLPSSEPEALFARLHSIFDRLEVPT